jgi:tRNA-specific 2-thiouridylase
MKNWEEDDRFGSCPAEQDVADAAAVCEKLGLKLHTRNFAAEYWDNVFEHFLDEYRAGRTPNPDILCNREIKFGVFRDYAQRLGSDWIATGHYARLRRDNGLALLKGVDANKDQTYFLHRVDASQLGNVLFPVGELTKDEVRDSARQIGLSVANKRDSTGICFIGERPFDEFLSQYVEGIPGPMRTPEGRTVGEHRGLAFYTLGQRQGLGLGGDAQGSGEPWYVVGKDMQSNTLTVAQGKDHPALLANGLTALDRAWVTSRPAGLATGVRLEARIRHRQRVQSCVVTASGEDQLAVVFDAPQRAVTPGQAIVFYDGDICIGGATIAASISAEAGGIGAPPRLAAGP